MNILPLTSWSGKLVTVVWPVIAAVGLAAPSEIALTNCIPPDLFLTDDNRLFAYKGHERLILVKRIEDAQKARESRPADQDPEGHWGRPGHGCQLSLRAEKEEFTNGEPVFVTMLLRNVSDKPITYARQVVMGQPSPIWVSVCKDERKLRLKTDDRIAVTSTVNVTLQPQTQHRYALQLNKFYDLTTNGIYFVQAEYGSTNSGVAFPVLAPGQEPIASQKVSISIMNAPMR